MNSVPEFLQPRRPSKPAAERLAALLSEGGLLTARLLQQTGLLGPELGDPNEPAGEAPMAAATRLMGRYNSEAPAPIGIWKPEDRGGKTVWVRDETQPNRDWWPPQRVIEPKKSLLPLRVCLLGESTAAGWFYAPSITPAHVLAGQLSALRPGLFEVLDLTMVNLQSAHLAEMTAAVLQIMPDVLVIFAGNNWPVRLPSYPGARLADSQAAAEALRSEGLAGLAEQSARRSRTFAEYTLDVVAAIAEDRGLPVVLVVPEVNLADWHRLRPAGWLRGAGSMEWHGLFQESVEALRRGDPAEALCHAEGMVSLDGGSCPSSHYLHAQALQLLGQRERAREAFRRAVDARGWNNLPSTPSATTAIQQALREGASRHGFALVDLAAIFHEHLGGEIPGRRLFLDYCHLTLEGMKVAMAAVACETLRLTESGAREGTEWKYVVETLPGPEVSPETEAVARFMTALYNTHYGSEYDPATGSQITHQSSATLHWLRSALATFPPIRETMLAYAATRAVLPEAMPASAALQRFHSCVGSIERQSAYNATLDPELFTRIAELCEDESLLETVIATHSVQSRSIRLSDPTYHWSVLDRYADQSVFGSQKTLFYRARWPASHFCLVSDATRDADLFVVARLPQEGSVEITLNDRTAATIHLSTRWTSHTVRLAASLHRRGFNRLTLRWPDLPPGDAKLTEIADRLATGVPTDLHPVFGEIFEMTGAGNPTRAGAGAFDMR